MTAVWYDESGSRSSEGYYVDGKLNGQWTKYLPDGTVERTEEWADGRQR